MARGWRGFGSGDFFSSKTAKSCLCALPRLSVESQEQISGVEGGARRKSASYSTGAAHAQDPIVWSASRGCLPQSMYRHARSVADQHRRLNSGCETNEKTSKKRKRPDVASDQKHSGQNGTEQRAKRDRTQMRRWKARKRPDASKGPKGAVLTCVHRRERLRTHRRNTHQSMWWAGTPEVNMRRSDMQRAAALAAQHLAGERHEQQLAAGKGLGLAGREKAAREKQEREEKEKREALENKAREETAIQNAGAIMEWDGKVNEMFERLQLGAEVDANALRKAVVEVQKRSNLETMMANTIVRFLITQTRQTQAEKSGALRAVLAMQGGEANGRVLRLTARPGVDITAANVYNAMQDFVPGNAVAVVGIKTAALPDNIGNHQQTFTLNHPDVLTDAGLLGKILQGKQPVVETGNEAGMPNELEVGIFNVGNECIVFIERNKQSDVHTLAAVARKLQWSRREIENLLLNALRQGNPELGKKVGYVRVQETRQRGTKWVDPRAIDVDPPLGGPMIIAGIMDGDELQRIKTASAVVKFVFGLDANFPILEIIGQMGGTLRKEEVLPTTKKRAMAKMNEERNEKVAQCTRIMGKFLTEITEGGEWQMALTELWVLLNAMRGASWEKPQAMVKTILEGLAEEDGAAAKGVKRYNLETIAEQAGRIQNGIQDAERKMAEDMTIVSLCLSKEGVKQITAGRHRPNAKPNKWKTGARNMLQEGFGKVGKKVMEIELVWDEMGEWKDGEVVIMVAQVDEGEAMEGKEEIQFHLRDGTAQKVRVCKMQGRQMMAEQGFSLMGAVMEFLQEGGILFTDTVGVSDGAETYTRMTQFGVDRPLEDGQGNPYDVRQLKHTWNMRESEVDPLFQILGQLRRQQKIEVVVRGDRNEAGFVLKELAQHLGKVQVDLMAIIDYGQDARERMQEILATQRLEEMSREVPYGVWVAGMQNGEAPEREMQEKVGRAEIEMGLERSIETIVKTIPMLKGQMVKNIGEQLIQAMLDRDEISITHVRGHTLLLPKGSGYVAAIREEASCEITPGKAIPFGQLRFDSDKRRQAKSALLQTGVPRIFTVKSLPGGSLKKVDAELSHREQEKHKAQMRGPTLSMAVPSEVGRVGEVIGEILTELQEVDLIKVFQGDQCWVVITGGGNEMQQPATMTQIYGPMQKHTMKLMIAQTTFGAEVEKIEKQLRNLEEVMCTSGARKISTPAFFQDGEVETNADGNEIINMREQSNWLTLIPLPIMLRQEGQALANNVIADLVDTGTCSLRKVPNGIILLNLEQTPEIAELDPADELWTTFQGTQQGDALLQALRWNIGQRQEKRGLPAREQQQAQELEKWVMLGQGGESDGTPPKGGEERDAEMSDEAVSKEKRGRAEEVDKRENPEGDENMRTEEEVNQAGKKKRQGRAGGSPNTKE